jgi:hypothetical protein
MRVAMRKPSKMSRAPCCSCGCCRSFRWGHSGTVAVAPCCARCKRYCCARHSSHPQPNAARHSSVVKVEKRRRVRAESQEHRPKRVETDCELQRNRTSNYSNYSNQMSLWEFTLAKMPSCLKLNGGRDAVRDRREAHASHVTRHTSHVTRHTSHVTRHTSHVTRHTSHVTRHTSHVTRHTSHVTRHTSHVTRHTSHVTRHTSHVTRHTSHVTRHTSHVTRHTSHVTRHTSHVTRHTSHVRARP